MTQAVTDVVKERTRQREKEHWSEAHDDKFTDGELALAAVCYALPPNARRLELFDGDYLRRRLWPWDLEWWKPKKRRQDLVRAAALMIAEIERLDRAAEKSPPR